MDIIVTTPKSEIANSAREAEEVIRTHSGIYFRKLPSIPKQIIPGKSRIFYTEENFIRGFCIIHCIANYYDKVYCDVTFRIWPPGHYILMNANTWNWIKPIFYRGFQGFLYYTPPPDMIIIGNWLSPKPDLKTFGL